MDIANVLSVRAADSIPLNELCDYDEISVQSVQESPVFESTTATIYPPQRLPLSNATDNMEMTQASEPSKRCKKWTLGTLRFVRTFPNDLG